jgi:CheY-like chemotaxis protein
VHQKGGQHSSGASQVDFEEKFRKGGCDAYIAKPIFVTDFLKTIQQFLR